MWQIVAAVALGGMQASAQRKAGAAAYRESLRQAAEIRKQRFDIEELAAQQHVDRMISFRDLQSTNNAYAAFEADIRGSIKPGKLADITVCDLNLMKIPPEDILKMNIEMTIVDGKIVYERAGN